MFLRYFTLCAALVLVPPLTYAQGSATKRTFDNSDVAPTTTVKAKKTLEKSNENPVSTTPEQSATAKSYKNESTPNKVTVVKTVVPKHKGEGYWQNEKVATVKPIAPTPSTSPSPQIYSEIHSSMRENGRFTLTSDTVVVKPIVATNVMLVATLTESTGDQELDKIIQNASRKNNIDPRLILEVIRQESGFRTQAVSNKGASGLMQLIPSTARRFGVVNIFDRGQNVHAGSTYLKFLLDTFNGDLDLALAGYNAGENAVIRYNYSIPPYKETRNYVRNITTRYRSRYHQVTTAIKETQIVHQVPLTAFASENGRVVLSNIY